jgi:EAL domain-containing protein (putative c-di-GMP-specific phosphodiesterase class I)/CheY-like chemotaxis protein
MPPKLLDDIRNWLSTLSGGDDPAAAAAAAQDPGPPCVFVIDDEDGICTFVSLNLAALGVEALSFHSAQQALRALDRRTPAIIFLDIALKQSDAVEVIRGLGERRYAGIVQMMSGSNPTLLDDVRQIGARHGLEMRPPLAKPFRAEAIRQVVAAARLQPARLPAAPPAAVGLDEALAKNWLELWYQPKINLRSKRFAGAEGLIRCRHPVHGILNPASFLPDAGEQSLVALTEYVVLKALRDWDEIAHANIHLHTAVNTTVAALARPDIVRLVREHRPNSDKWPGLILEITEGEVVKNVEVVHEMATQLNIYGITLSIDDFGEGFSSFARLRELRFAELKLDRSFVNNCASDAKNAGICQAIINLAHHFGAVAVAEGLENGADLQAIHRMGCDVGQGFFFARPMPKADFIALIRERMQQRRAS